MRRYKMTFLSVICFAVCFSFSTSCARKKMSDRDSKREQVRSTADAKRQELALAAGLYRGFLKQNGVDQDITLKLEIKDIPDTSTGEVDPILVPILTGSLRLTFGSTETGEYYSYAIEKADFDPNRKKVDLVVNNEHFKQIVLSLEQFGDGFVGTWNAPTLSSSGETELHKAENPLTLQSSNTEIRGDYQGFLVWDELHAVQNFTMNLQTSFNDSDVKLSTIAKLIFGTTDTGEQLVYKLDETEFNPITGVVSFKSKDSEISLRGRLENGVFDGEWIANNRGKMGKFQVSKKSKPMPPDGYSILSSLKGVYQGALTNTSSQTNLPERFMIGLVTTPDPTSPRGIKISGNARLYLGPFDSTEFVEAACDSIQFDFFIRILTMKCAAPGIGGLSIKGDVGASGITGPIYHDSLGEIGTYEVIKL